MYKEYICFPTRWLHKPWQPMPNGSAWWSQEASNHSLTHSPLPYESFFLFLLRCFISFLNSLNLEALGESKKDVAGKCPFAHMGHFAHNFKRLVDLESFQRSCRGHELHVSSSCLILLVSPYCPHNCLRLNQHLTFQVTAMYTKVADPLHTMLYL